MDALDFAGARQDFSNYMLRTSYLSLKAENCLGMS